MKLTYEEKAALLDGADVWHTKAFKDFPSIMMADGPHGLRKQLESTDTTGISGSVKSTCFPTASLTACSFDRNLIARMAKLIALEAQTNQVNIILGPGINIKRSPLCGRNFEENLEHPLSDPWNLKELEHPSNIFSATTKKNIDSPQTVLLMNARCVRFI